MDNGDLFSRRATLAMMLAGSALPAVARAASSGLEGAILLAFPLFEFARTGWGLAGPSAEHPAGRYNQLIHRRVLTDPSQRAITATNNDCLVSNARIDLSSGALLLDVPDIRDRYFSIALMDAFTDNFRFIGTRATHGAGGRFLLAPPGWRGALPQGVTRIDTPSTDVWMLVRILVDGAHDYARVNTLQDRITLTPVGGDGAPGLLPVAPGDGRDPANLLAVANAMLARIPVHDPRVRRAAGWAALGLKRGVPEAFAALSRATQAQWRRELPETLARLALPRPGAVRKSDGWSYSAATLGTFGGHDFLRAQIALIGLAALPPEEAFYGQALSDADGAPFEGSHAYRLRVPAGGPPVDAFWSLTMYQVENDGRLFLTPNPIERYSIGDRTPGLVRNADGSLDILMQHGAPDNPLAANWLPTPAGPFRPSFRAYLARPALLSLKWRLPAIERTA